MSVVVRMEMPSGCHDCKLRNMVGNCPIPMFDGQDEKKIWTLEECFQRPPWCPIICSLPEGHGRLIDASTIIGEVDAGYTDDYGNPIPANRPISVDEYLGLEVPTIVPAERSEK